MRKRRVPKQWKNVFDELFAEANYNGMGFSRDKVLSLAIAEGINISREGVRVKLARYVASGYLKKVKRDRYGLGKGGYFFFALLEPRELRVVKSMEEHLK